MGAGTARRWLLGGRGTSGRPGRVATLVYGVGSAVLVTHAASRWLAVRASLASPPGHLVSTELADTLWTAQLVWTVLLVVLPAGAALSHEALPEGLGTRGVVLRPATAAAALTWAVGAGLTSWRWWWADGDAGWFNYAPNSGVVFFAQGGAGPFVRGPLLMSVGLLVSAACLLLTVLRARRDRSPRSWPAAVWPQVALQVLVIVCLAPLAIDLVRLWLTGEGRVWWL